VFRKDVADAVGFIHAKCGDAVELKDGVPMHILVSHCMKLLRGKSSYPHTHSKHIGFEVV
jgi:hypothetical protein